MMIQTKFLSIFIERGREGESLSRMDKNFAARDFQEIQPGLALAFHKYLFLLGILGRRELPVMF